MIDSESQTVQYIVDYLYSKGIAVDINQQFTVGDKCKTVFVGNDTCTGEKLVIKLGIDATACSEVFKNIAGYDEIRNLGIKNFIPPRIDVLEYRHTPIIVMTHCGLDFWQQTYQEEKPEKLYELLVLHMHEIYRSTLHTPANPYVTADKLKKLLTSIYVEKLGDVTSDSVKNVLAGWNHRNLVVPMICFASFDFTPANTFVNDERVTYIDPKAGQTGVPILDMSCFAGMARNAVNLPGSVEGYKTIHQYATTDLANILNLSTSTAETIFALGQSVQLGLSSYYRREKEPNKAEKMLKTGQQLLESTIKASN